MTIASQILAVMTEIGNDMKTALANSGGGSPSVLIAQVRNSDISSNINTTAWVSQPVNDVTDFLDTGFTLGNVGVVCQFTGRVRITTHIGYTVSGARVNVKVRAAVAGVGLTTEGKSGYVRNASGHNEASCTVTQYANVVTGEQITLQTMAEAAGTTTVMDDGGCMLLIERL